MENEENQIGGEQAETPTADGVNDTEEQQSAEIDFSEAQKLKVNDIVRERLNQDRMSRLKKYGYATEDELDSIVEKGKKYDELKTLSEELLKDRESLYFLKARIKDEKIDDVKTYFKGKGLDLTLEQLIELTKTHPEWLKPEVKGNTLKTLGFNNQNKTIRQNAEESFKEKLYGSNKSF